MYEALVPTLCTQLWEPLAALCLRHVFDVVPMLYKKQTRLDRFRWGSQQALWHGVSLDGATDLEHGWASDLPAALDERLECVADVIRICGLNCTLELRDMLADCVAALDRSVRDLRGDGQIDSHKKIKRARGRKVSH